MKISVRITVFALILTAVCCQTSFGAGSNASPAIDISDVAIAITNGAASCVVNTDHDKVELTVSGGSDTDQCVATHTPDFGTEYSRWTKTTGTLDSLTGTSTKWLATATGVATIRVYMNDNDSGEFNDDESSVADSVTMTGALVGCLLTTDGGGVYTLWNNGTSTGNEDDCEDSLSVSLTRSTSGSTSESEDTTNGVWKLVVNPADTPLKGKIKAGCKVNTLSGTGGGISVFAKDSDWDVGANGTHTVEISVPTTYATFSYSYSYEDEDNCAGGSAAYAVSGWHSLHKDKISYVSETSAGSTSSAPIFSDPETKYLTGDEDDEKTSRVKASAQCDVKLDGSNTASVTAESKLIGDYEITTVTYEDITP